MSETHDLWRDLYIWNSMILNVEYETNGIESEWYWFSNGELDLTYSVTTNRADGNEMMYTADSHKIFLTGSVDCTDLSIHSDDTMFRLH